MSIAELRETLTQALTSAEGGNVPETVRMLKAALRDVDAGHLLTTTEAAQLLGVRSINTIKAWHRSGYLHGVAQGSRTLIPLSEVERIQDSERVRRIRAAERLHDQSADLGGDEELSAAEIDALETGRPGTLPWKREAAGSGASNSADGGARDAS